MSSAKVFVAEKNVRNQTATEKKKTVYKNVLASPFILKWPTIHTDLGQTALTQLLKVLEPVGEYKKKCRAQKKELKKNKEVPSIPIPDIAKRLHVGINETTRFLESYIEQKSNTQPVIYICKREIKPVQLCQHILYMAALAQVKLVPLPADSECRIGETLGINRASVVVVEVMENKEEALRLTAKEVPLVDAPWLLNALEQKVEFRKDNVKILKTSAPLIKKNLQLKRKNGEEDQDVNKKVKSS